MTKKVVEKIILSFLIIYWFNQIGINFNLLLPINSITLLIIFILDIPGLALLLAIMIFY